MEKPTVNRNDSKQAAPSLQTATHQEGTFFWNLYARCYDSIYHLMPYRKLLWDTLQALDLKPGMKVLDAGCGTGNFELFTSEKKIPRVQIESIDSSPAMLARAQEKCKCLEYVNFRLADLNRRLNYSDCTFDRVLSLDVLGLVMNPFTTLREFLRVTKPNGRLVISNPIASNKAFAIMHDHLRRFKNIQRFPTQIMALVKIPVLFPVVMVLPMLNLNLRTNFTGGQQDGDRKPRCLDTKEVAVLLRKLSFHGADISYVYAGQNWLGSVNKTVSDKAERPLLRVEKERLIENEWERKILAELYYKSFEEIDRRCICKQSYSSEELEEVLTDSDVLKVILYDSTGFILGFGLVTNNLEKVPWLSLPYFKTSFPDYFENRIYYVTAFVVDTRYRGLRSAKKLLGEIIEVVPRDSLGAFDFSEQVNGLIPRLAFEAAPHPIEPIDNGPVDRQVYHIFRWAKS